MTVQLKENDIKTLISLVTERIDGVADVREKYGFYAPGYLLRLVDMRNRLKSMLSGEELPSSISDEEWQELLRG